jgi:hypothetical protein
VTQAAHWAAKNAVRDREIADFASTFMLPMSRLVKMHGQLFDNREIIAERNARLKEAALLDPDKMRQDGRAPFCTLAAFTLKVDCTFKQVTEKSRGDAPTYSERLVRFTRFVNFQSPYYFKLQFLNGTIDPSYRESHYEPGRQTIMANNRNKAEGELADMIGHFERDMAEVKRRKGKRGKRAGEMLGHQGKCRLPYNWAMLTWRNDGLPTLFIVNAFEAREAAMTRKLDDGLRSADRNPALYQFIINQ